MVVKIDISTRKKSQKILECEQQGLLYNLVVTMLSILFVFFLFCFFVVVCISQVYEPRFVLLSLEAQKALKKDISIKRNS